MNHTHCLNFALAFILTFAIKADAQTLEDVLPYIPQDANVVSLLNVEALISSPIGVEQGWADKHEQAYLDGSLTIPPWVQQFVRASHLTPGVRGEKWNVAFVPLDSDSRLEKISKLEDNEIQDLRGVRSVLSSRHGGYFAELRPEGAGVDKSVLGLLAPASRQEAANWIASASSGTKISKYLQDSVNDPKSQLIIAMDMNEMLDPKQIHYRLYGSPALKGDKLSMSALTLDFQTLQGVRLSVTAGTSLTAEIRLDFNRSIGAESKYIQPVLMEFLGDAGAELEDFATANVSVVGKSVLLSTPLSAASFRKILSLITTPHPAASRDAMPDPASPKSDSEDAAAPYDLMASKRYYRAILKNLEDLEKTYQAKSGSYARSASWHLSYAKRIDHMPTAGVHPELQDFAAAIAINLRILGDSLRGSQVEMQQLNNEIRYSKEYKYEPQTGYEWWWGPARTPSGYVATPENTKVIVHTNLDEVRAQQQQAAEAGGSQREAVWKKMSDQRNAVQTDMVKVFGREFLEF